MSEAERTVTISLAGIDKAIEQVASIKRALRGLKDKPNPHQVKQRRFEMLCIDLFRVMCRGRPDLDAARIMVIGVEGGEIARRHIGKFAADRFPHLSEVERAFAVGLAMGFMTEFLPREAEA